MDSLVCSVCGREFPSNATDIEVDTTYPTENPEAHGVCSECGGDVFFQECV